MVRKDTREAWLLKDEGLGAERAPENEVGIYRLIESYYPGTRCLAWKNGEVGSRGAVRESCGWPRAGQQWASIEATLQAAGRFRPYIP